MPNVEEHIKEYIREKTRGTQDGIRVPLSQIASELDYSTATVWRAIQKLKGKRIVKIIKSHNKAEADKMYYVGEENDLVDTVDELIQRTNGILVTLQELKEKIEEQEDAIFELIRD